MIWFDGPRTSGAIRGVNSRTEGLIDDAEKVDSKDRIKSLSKGDKRECDYVSQFCLRRSIYTFGTSRHTPQSSLTQRVNCEKYKEQTWT